MKTIGGIPLTYWIVGAVAGVIGFVWMRQKTTTKQGSAAGPGAGAPQFTQAQEVQDFQIFSALTGAQQASDLNFLSEVAGLFAGGSSPSSSSSGGGSTVPSPPSTGSMPPAVAQQYQQEVATQLGGQGGPGTPALAQAISSTPASQRGGLENFFLLNEANQRAGYDYYTSQGLQSTPLGVAPGE